MKTSHILPLIILAASATLASAAPAISVQDISPATLKGVATDKQKASMKLHDEAKAKANSERETEIAEIKKVTADNNAGMKKTIQKRTLNNMLPACEREPEAPREPGNYEVR
ncbi:MAG: hypothetical protein R3Y56_10825 [Akkermansia sp.]